MELNVGDYVITKDRLHIGKIYNINEFREPSMMYAIDFPNTDDFIFMGENDFNSNPKIINLIEVGDYVNGMQVTRVCFDEDEQRILNLSNCILELMNEDIKSVLTHEQFEAMKYVVGNN